MVTDEVYQLMFLSATDLDTAATGRRRQLFGFVKRALERANGYVARGVYCLDQVVELASDESGGLTAPPPDEGLPSTRSTLTQVDTPAVVAWR